MKKGLLLILSVFIYAYSFCQVDHYWQQKVDYKIDVSLNDTAKMLDGYIRMQYFNNSPDTLHFIWFHVWPNAYKNDRTAFSDQFIENGRKDFYFSNESKRGYINRLDFKVDKTTALLEDHPQHQDIIKLVLPKPLAPGTSINIETPFHVKLPFNFSRGGYIDKSFQLTQWYPKPAVYDRKGWHEMPYLDQGEFYSEFGEYDVQVTVPKEYVVASTGPLKAETTNGDTKTLHYIQNNIHDFAWFADRNFEVMHDTLQLATHVVDVYCYYIKPDVKRDWAGSIDFIKSAIRTKSNWVGEYPYNIVSVVERPGKGDGGMEYPTITLISKPDGRKMLDFLVNHEVGHNWFYGILASNERQHPWMDEGMNSYYDREYYQQQYGLNGIPIEMDGAFIKKRMPDDIEDVVLRSMAKTKTDQPIETTSEAFSEFNYGLTAYRKTANWMSALKNTMGEAKFDSLMRRYFNEWKFKHPYPEDFKLLAEEVAGLNLDAVFALLNTKGYIASENINAKTPGLHSNRKLKITSFFSLKETDRYNYIFLSPAIGYNNYDKFMAGLLIHNYTLPPAKFKFMLSPLYATGSKQFNGIGNINYSVYTGKKISQVTLGVTGARFSTRQSLDTFDNKIFENFYKIVPSLQLYFKHGARSHTTSWIDFRTYIIGEQSLTRYEFKANSDSSVYYPTATRKSDHYINQLSFNLANARILYPYDYQLKLQQGKGFYRLDLNANYFFNYPKGGGMAVRLFASKFGYLGEKDFSTYQYWPKLLAATGTDDYTYSNYFIGRTASTSNAEQPVKNVGLGARQVMMRDGGLKLRLDQFEYLQGRTDNWAAAMNFNTTLPDVFPFKLPIKLFFDLGTNAETWKEDSQLPRFLYVGGLQLSLFKNVLNIYAPLIYSKDFKDVMKTLPEQSGFFKRITFSIDVQNISLRKIFPQIPF